jgi:hypothetical protein
MKVTDLKCNQRVKTMEPSEDDLKMKKNKYIEEKCDEDGCIIENNLTSGGKGNKKIVILLFLAVFHCYLLLLAVTC